MLTSTHQVSEESPAVYRDTVQVLSSSFDNCELEGLIQCLTEDGHVCNVFADAGKTRQALSTPRTRLLLIGLSLENVWRWIEELQAENLNSANVPIIAYFKEPSLANKEAWLPADRKELLLHVIDDFLLPPLSLYDMRLRVHRLTQRFSEKEDTIQACKLDLLSQLGMQRFIGKAPAFMAAIEKIPRIAGCDATVLLIGDTGTGKEMCARTIHYLSPRAKKPFIPVNCGSIPSDLFENEMFGHESGAFTDARHSQRGLIAEADGGTLFLDEVDSLPLSAQVKILRFLQDREYRPLGAHHYRRADTRLIAASNQNLKQRVRDHLFREDLYYRLDVVSLQLPNLRDRQEDILPLALHFLTTFANEYHSQVTHFSPGAIKRLIAYNWPGNVRELENVIRRSVITADGAAINPGDIQFSTDLPNQIFPETEPFKAAKARAVSAFERSYLSELISSCNGNVSKAARHAQKNRRAFFALLKKYDMTSVPQREPMIRARET